MIDDPDSPHKLAYLLTKPLKIGHSYNGEGTYKFVLQEVTATKNDNHELGIADYYSHFPNELEVADDPHAPSGKPNTAPNPGPVPAPPEEDGTGSLESSGDTNVNANDANEGTTVDREVWI